MIGRSTDLARLVRAIGPGTDGVRVVRLYGPSGIGKTTLVHAAIAEVGARAGFAAALGTGRSATLGAPCTAWVDALPELRALLVGRTTGATVDELGLRVATALEARAAAAPLLLVFDDAQALDESSLALVRPALEVDPSANITLLLIEQSDAVLDGRGSYDRCCVDLAAAHVVQHLELGPLGDDAVSALIATELGTDAGDPVPAELLLRAGGNPWFARELARTHRDGSSDLPTSIAAAATVRLEGLPTDHHRQLLAYLALCPHGAHTNWLRRLWHDSAARPGETAGFEAALELLVERALVRCDGDVVMVTNPLMADAINGESSAALRRALHREIAEAVAAVEGSPALRDRALGHHLALAGQVDQAVLHLVRSADAHEAAGRPHEAALDYAQALAVEPRVDQRLPLLRRCAMLAMQLGLPDAAERWNEVGRIAAARGDDETYALSLFQQYWTSCDGARIDRLERAVALGSDRLGWSARAAACLCVLAADYAGAVEHDSRALAIARDRGDSMLEVIALEKLGMSYSLLGDLDAAIAALREAVALAVRLHDHHIAVHARTALAELLGDALQTDASRGECEAALRSVDELGVMRYRPMVLAYCALALVRCGRVGDAVEAAREASALDARTPRNQFTALVAGVHAHVAVEAGDQAALSLLDHAEERVREHGYASFLFEIEFERARCRATAGDIDGALDAAGRLSIEEPAAMARLAQWLVRLAVRARSTAAADLAAHVRASIDATLPLTHQILEEVDATLAALGGTGDPAALDAIADAWRAAGRVLDAERARASYAMLLAEGEIAAERLRTAQLELSRCGALGDADVLQRYLRELGHSARARTRASNVGGLTERELQVVRLVAQGMRNVDVAEALHVSDRTVAGHLASVYGKLGLRSRTRLATWLEEQEAPAPSLTSVA